MKNLLSLMLVLLTSFSKAESAELCSYSMKLNDGNYYSLKDYNTFLKMEFRPQLSKNKGHFEVVVARSCENKAMQTVPIKFDSQTYIIDNINGHDIDRRLKQYYTPKLLMDARQIDKAFDVALKENFASLNNLEEKQNALKLFYFIFSDAARFDDVKEAVNNLLFKGCSYQRADYIPLLRSWKKQSEYIYFHDIKTGKSYKGGGNCDFYERYCLIAPIPHAVVEKFSQSRYNEENNKLLPDDHCSI